MDDSRQPNSRTSPGWTFRVRGVPLDWDANRLRDFLAEQPDSASPTVRSLADEIHGRSRTATVSFPILPSQLETTRRSWQISLPAASNQSSPPQCLMIDDDFLGITTLYAPPSQDHRVDIVAISGLGGHAFGSFKEKGGAHMWLRDALPYHINAEGRSKPARVMVYGYESSLHQGEGFQNIEDLGAAFRTSLLTLVGVGMIRSIIVLAHSLGGLVVKQTLISLSKSKSQDHQKLLQAVYGIAFFGVPHDGMDIRSLIPIVGDRANRYLLESISNVNSQTLTQQRRDFPDAMGGKDESGVVCFYETCMSSTAVEVDGKWEMRGPPAVLVTKASATHCPPWGDREEHIYPIYRTHSEIVKFRLEDHEYEKVLESIGGLVRRALKRSAGDMPDPGVGAKGTTNINQHVADHRTGNMANNTGSGQMKAIFGGNNFESSGGPMQIGGEFLKNR